MIVHESGHIMENYQGNVVASMGRERAIAANDAISRGGMSAYGMTSPQEAYAEAWAQWTLGDGSDGVYDETARGLAEVFGWPDPPNRSRAVIRPGTRKSIQDLLDTLQDKVRHVRDADYWEHPGYPATPAEEPKAPDPIEGVAPVPGPGHRGGSTTRPPDSEHSELSIQVEVRADLNYEDVRHRRDRQRSRLEGPGASRAQRHPGRDEPYPDSTIEQVDFYIYECRTSMHADGGRWNTRTPWTHSTRSSCGRPNGTPSWRRTRTSWPCARPGRSPSPTCPSGSAVSPSFGTRCCTAPTSTTTS